ncbi:uncharacterized protein BDZ99DRAFT_511210 [Mytilinidion resinicola]|uniref:Polyprenal reductase n=1 Tax=Mytilinidion resinicola TaxID=574789 RepID=A0A6A6Y8H0_9PEZI|nr:uncharacterized protein BDZ99DRAFT_511210 [Mytilinidion resinicola]KAF2805131.1 hypothetical protein BDZ99DRAFT_511210 [Mytilinidion resinicola]
MDLDGPLAALLDPVLLLRAFYLAAAALILLISAVPALSDRFLAYGSRSARSPAPRNAPTVLARVLDHLTTYRVPHLYFAHFYILSILSSLFWAHQIWTRGPGFELLATFVPEDSPTMTLPQIYMVWALMLLQGVRRLLECLVSASNSMSTMWIGHYILGHLFYLAVNISIWIEGVQAIRAPSPSSHPQPAFSSLILPLVLPILLAAHVGQHSYHAYLSSLRATKHSYSLPSHPLFPNAICPHYTLETLIYICLALLAAPEGRLVNWTVATGAVFVAVNLGVTAHGTKAWYVDQFGEEKVAQRWKMVPWVW